MSWRVKKSNSQWNTVKDTFSRSLGTQSLSGFRERARASKYFIQRLELSEKLNFHDGCVNSLNFNEQGNLIASGSDDCNVAIWNWMKNTKEPLLWYDSGHNSNVFQVIFICYSFYRGVIWLSLVWVYLTPELFCPNDS